MKFDRIALKITFFIFISGLVLMSTVAISQAASVDSWTPTPLPPEDPHTILSFREDETQIFKVDAAGTVLNKVNVKFELSSLSGLETGSNTVRLNASGVAQVTSQTAFSRGLGLSTTISDGRWTLTATVEPTDTDGNDVTIDDDVSPIVWKFWVSPEEGDEVPLVPKILPGPPSSPNPDAPVFREGESTTRSIPENTPSGQPIGSPVTATDPQNDLDEDDGDYQTLYYTLSGTNAGWFSIHGSTGQLRTHGPLDFETKESYAVTVSVSDGETSRSISVTIDVTDVADETGPQNNVPVFTDGKSTTRYINAGTSSGKRIPSPVTATDADSGDTLTYTLGGKDAASFSIESSTGYLLTSASLTSPNSYVVTITVSDDHGAIDSIIVFIGVTAAGGPYSGEDPPVPSTLSGGPRGLGGSPPPQPPSSGGTPPSEQTPIPKNNNNAPVFTDGASTTRSIAENTTSGTNIGTAIAATDADNDTLTYTLSGTDAAAFGIVSTSGQLQTKAALDFETKKSYAVTVSVSDGKDGSDSISVSINITDVAEGSSQPPPQPPSGADAPPPAQPPSGGAPPPEQPPVSQNRPPVFTDGASTTRSIAENTASGTNIGTAIAATDADNDTLTYTLSGTDAALFSIVSTTGQLQTSTALDYETKNSYAVRVSVSDNQAGSDAIDVRIRVTDVNDAPVFTDGTSTTRTIAENTVSGTNIGAAVGATDQDGQTLTYTLSGDDASSFRIVSTSGQLQTSAVLDYETKRSYAVTVTASDGALTDTITVRISVTDVTETPANNAPVFTEGANTTRAVAENTASGQNIGTAIAATDADSGDTLTYTLGGTDAGSFRIVGTTGQLQTSAALDFETKNSYAVRVSVSDNKGGSAAIDVRISVTNANDAPVFTEGTSTTRTIAENTASGQNIGTAIAATDADSGDTLTYTLGGTDTAAFSILSTSGQLQTSAALDFETKNSYAVTVSVSDGKGGSDSISVSVDITDVAETVEQPPAQPPAGGTEQPIIPPVQPPAGGTEQPIIPPVQPPVQPPASGGTQQSSTPPARSQPVTPVNHTIKPFDYERTGVGKVVFSEWMLSTLNDMPQWIELYNTTNKDINLRDWQIVGRFMDGNGNIHMFKPRTIRALTVKAKQSHLIVAYSASVRGCFF